MHAARIILAGVPVCRLSGRACAVSTVEQFEYYYANVGFSAP